MIGQGTWNVEQDDRAEVVRSLRRGLDLGMTHIDTAELHGSGRVEEIIGDAIAGPKIARGAPGFSEGVSMGTRRFDFADAAGHGAAEGLGRKTSSELVGAGDLAAEVNRALGELIMVFLRERRPELRASTSATRYLLDVVSLPPRPTRLPLLESLSWFDADPYALSPREMLLRYESGWRHAGVLGDASAEELAYLAALVRAFGSVLDVPA